MNKFGILIDVVVNIITCKLKTYYLLNILLVDLLKIFEDKIVYKIAIKFFLMYLVTFLNQLLLELLRNFKTFQLLKVKVRFSKHCVKHSVNFYYLQV